MKPVGVFINIGSSKNIDIFALIDCLSQHKFLGAWLDFPNWDVPDWKHPLYNVNNSIISVENIDNSGLRIERAFEDFLQSYEKVKNLGEDFKSQDIAANLINGKIDTEFYRFVD